MHYNITLFGNKTTTVGLMRHLKAAGHDIDLVVTLSREAEASRDIAGAGDIAAAAGALGIPLHVTMDYALKSEADKKFFAENTFGIGVCTGWQRLLPRHVLAAYPAGIFGFHGSGWKFPHGRGRSPLNWATRLGHDRVYHNCFRYVPAADAGAVYNTTEFPITPFDDISTIQFKALLDMKATAARLLSDHKAGRLAHEPQPDGAAVTLPKLGPADGKISFAHMSRAEILALVRATSRPFPGAFAEDANGAALRIWRAIPFEFPLQDSPPPGTVIDASLGQVLFACRDGLLLAVDIDAEGTAPANGMRFS